MPANTPNRSYTYATSGDANDLALISQRLAEQIDADVQSIITQRDAIPTPTNLTPDTAWSTAPGYPAASLTLIGPEIALNGTLVTSAAKSIGALVTVLPLGSRPATRRRFGATSGPSGAVVEVLTNGNVILGTAVASGGTISLDDVRFVRMP